MPIVKLDAAFIASQLICPPGKVRIEYVCADQSPPGFYAEVRATSPGECTYYLRYKDPNGISRHIKIGRSSAITLTEARKKAKEIKSSIVLGADPRAEETARKATLKLSEFFDEHYWPHIQVRKRSAKRDEELFRLRIRGRFGHLRLNELTRQQVQNFHSDLRAEGLAPASCDHHVKLIRQMLNLAVEWELLEKNPASRLRLFNADNKVEHRLDDQQLADLLGVLRTDANRTVCHIALFLLSTGARLNEALSAKWSQIDRAGRTWRIPALNSKSGRVRSVPLNDSALDVLCQLDTEGEFEHLFVNKRRSQEKEAPYTTIMKVWDRIRKAAKLPHLRIHDLRHLYASFLVSSGRTLYEVQQILGHSAPIVTQRYAHLSTKSLQDAANAASVVILGKPEPEQQSATGAEGGGVAAARPEVA